MKARKEIDHLTQSMLRDYKSCPKLFYYRYYLRLKLPQKQLNLVFGGAVHDALEEYHKNFNVNESVAVFKKMFPIWKLSEDERMFWREHLVEGERLVREYDRVQPYLTEVYGISPHGQSEGKFKAIWKDPYTGEELALPITGRFDRITDKNQVVEFKTSKKAYNQGKTDELDQATVYGYSHELITGKKVDEFFYIILIKGRQNPIQVIKTKRNKEDYVRMFREAKSIIERIKNKEFKRGCRGYQVNFCDCRKFDELLSV